MHTSHRISALQEAIDKSGASIAVFASSLTSHLKREKNPVLAAHVWNWLRRDGGAPAWIAPSIEALTGVTCERLCPETRWDVLRSSSGVVSNELNTPFTAIAANKSSFLQAKL